MLDDVSLGVIETKIKRYEIHLVELNHKLDVLTDSFLESNALVQKKFSELNNYLFSITQELEASGLKVYNSKKVVDGGEDLASRNSLVVGGKENE